MNETTLIPLLSLGWLLICSFAASVLGITCFLKKSALYMKLITYGMGCFAMSYLFALLWLLTRGEAAVGFHIGTLGSIGGMTFLFSASYGQMDGLVDDRTKVFRKYRMMALLAPLAVLLIALPVLLGSVGLAEKLVMLVQSAFIAGAAYYNLKHLIIPDVELGLIQSVRGFNLLALELEMLMALELMAFNLENNIMIILFSIAAGIVFVMLIPVLKKGVKKWTL